MAAVGVIARSGGAARILLSHVNVRASSTMAAPGSFYALQATDLDGESGRLRSRDSQMHFTAPLSPRISCCLDALLNAYCSGVMVIL